jgi:hypothetical protein
LGKYKYDTWRILPVKCYIDNSVCLRSCIQNTNSELVLLKLQPYAQSSVVSRPYPKLNLKYFGPYKVLEHIGQATYKLELPLNALLHPIFHVSQLKSSTPDHILVFSELLTTPQLDLVELEP